MGVFKSLVFFADNTEDVTIIGAGLGGTYAAYKLKDKNLTIGLYEMSDRIGGRYFTRRMKMIPDIDIELGAMRFMPAMHRRLYGILQELGLPIVDFEQKFGIPSKYHYYLRGQHISFADLGKPGFMPYNVNPSEILPGDELLFKLVKENTNASENLGNGTIVTKDGIPIFKQSMRQMFNKFASNEAYLYMKDITGFHSQFDDASGENFRAGKPKDRQNLDSGLPVVKAVGNGGFQSVAETLLKRFLQKSKSHRLYKNHKLIEIEPVNGGRIKLIFHRTVTEKGVTSSTSKELIVYTKNVILCIPKEPLQLINWTPLQNESFNQKVLNSVFAVPASKIFLGYSSPWWKQVGVNFTHAVTDLPIRQIYEWKVSNTTGNAIILASYTDISGVTLWKRTRDQGRAFGGTNNTTDVTDEVIKHVHLNLAAVYNISVDDIPTPIDGAMYVFDGDPFNGGWYSLSPGYKMEDVRFSQVKPSCNENVFIASGCYSSFHLLEWSEGSLEVVEEVLKVIFGQVNTSLYPCRQFN